MKERGASIPRGPKARSKRRGGSSPPGPRFELGEKQVEALTVAMVVAPGVYARNRMFDFLSSAGARRARMRAAIIRGLLSQLGRATTVTLEREVRGSEPLVVLRYAIPSMRLTRVVELSETELAALRLAAERLTSPPESTRPPYLLLDAEDRSRVTRALARLLDEPRGDVARLVRELGITPAE